MFSASKTASPSRYNIQRSVRLRSSASAYFNRATTSTGNPQKLTWSGWVKRGALANGVLFANAGASADFFSFSSDVFRISFSGGTTVITTNSVYRDPSAWYHIVVAIDTTQATAANRVLLWVNGVAVTSFSAAAYPTQNSNTSYNTSGTGMLIGQVGSSTYFDGYLTEINYIDGQALTPTSFGSYNSFTGVWQPIKYSGTYGTNGFYLNFQDNSGATATTIGKDSSGNGNNWTPNNISVTAGVTYDSMVDVPTLTGAENANFAVLNPLDKDSGNTVVDGNLKVTTSSSGQGFQRGTMFVNSGKWYWEVTVTSATGNSSIGIAGQSTIANTTNYVGSTSDSYGYVATNGNKYNSGSNLSYGSTYTTNDVIGVALDMDAGTLAFYKNNTSQGTAYSSLSGFFAPAISDVSNSSSSVFNVNFGQRPFTYTPPTGFKSLNTYNLPDSTIPNGATQFAATTYTGTGSAMTVTNTVNSTSLQPDFLWIKQRNNAANHVLADSIRGVNKYIFSNLTNAEATATAGTGITSFNSNGFSLGTETSTVGSVNAAGGTGTYIAWQWRASNASAVTNTSGTITSSVSANPTAGFSIVTYTNAATSGTVGHGLGVAPSMIIMKGRGPTTANWTVFHSSLANMTTAYLNLNSTAAAGTLGSAVSAPTSTTFGTNSTAIPASENSVAYCFAQIAGFSKFGSYTGTGTADGPFVYTGFRPRFVCVKRTDTTGGWTILDSSRDPYNVGSQYLFAETSAAEGSTALEDFLSNGFKLRASSTSTNGAGTYIYFAFAENPFNYSLAR